MRMGMRMRMRRKRNMSMSVNMRIVMSVSRRIRRRKFVRLSAARNCIEIGIGIGMTKLLLPRYKMLSHFLINSVNRSIRVYIMSQCSKCVH